MFVRSEDDEVEVVVESVVEAEDEVLGARVDTSIASTIGFATKNWRSLRAVAFGVEPERGGAIALDDAATGAAWRGRGGGLAAAGAVCP